MDSPCREFRDGEPKQDKIRGLVTAAHLGWNVVHYQAAEERTWRKVPLGKSKET